MPKYRRKPETIRFALALIRLKVTQAWVCRVLNRDKSTVSRWANGGAIPAEVSMLFAAAIEGKLSVGDIERMHLDLRHQGSNLAETSV